MGNTEIFDKKKLTFPDAFSNAATISKTDVPLPVPKLYTSQPVDTCTNKFYIQPCLNNINIKTSRDIQQFEGEAWHQK